SERLGSLVGVSVVSRPPEPPVPSPLASNSGFSREQPPPSSTTTPPTKPSPHLTADHLSTEAAAKPPDPRRGKALWRQADVLHAPAATLPGRTPGGAVALSPAMARSTVLVTGATGLLGKELVPRLVRRGAHVHVLVRPDTLATAGHLVERWVEQARASGGAIE